MFGGLLQQTENTRHEKGRVVRFYFLYACVLYQKCIVLVNARISSLWLQTNIKDMVQSSKLASLTGPTRAEVRACKQLMRQQFTDFNLRLSHPVQTSKDQKDLKSKDETASQILTVEELCFDAIVQNHNKRCLRSSVAAAQRANTKLQRTKRKKAHST